MPCACRMRSPLAGGASRWRRGRGGARRSRTSWCAASCAARSTTRCADGRVAAERVDAGCRAGAGRRRAEPASHRRVRSSAEPRAADQPLAGARGYVQLGPRRRRDRARRRAAAAGRQGGARSRPAGAGRASSGDVDARRRARARAHARAAEPGVAVQVGAAARRGRPRARAAAARSLALRRRRRRRARRRARPAGRARPRSRRCASSPRRPSTWRDARPRAPHRGARRRRAGPAGGAASTRCSTRSSGRMRAQRQLVADASHELRTPLTSLRTNIEVLARANGAARPGDRERAAARRRRRSSTS